MICVISTTIIIHLALFHGIIFMLVNEEYRNTKRWLILLLITTIVIAITLIIVLIIFKYYSEGVHTMIP